MNLKELEEMIEEADSLKWRVMQTKESDRTECFWRVCKHAADLSWSLKTYRLELREKRERNFPQTLLEKNAKLIQKIRIRMGI